MHWCPLREMMSRFDAGRGRPAGTEPSVSEAYPNVHWAMTISEVEITYGNNVGVMAHLQTLQRAKASHIASTLVRPGTMQC